MESRSSTMDQYKRPVLLLDPGSDDAAIGIHERETVPEKLPT